MLEGLSAQYSRRDAVDAGQIFQLVKIRLRLVHPPLKVFDCVFGGDAGTSVIETYAACRLPQASDIVNCLLKITELSLSVFKFFAQASCLLCVPFGVLGFHIWFGRRRLR